MNIHHEGIRLPHLTLARYRFTLLPEQNVGFPNHMGNTLRGGFGHAFKQMVCFQPQVKRCQDCPLRNQCPYAYVFATPVPPDAEVLSKNSRAPVPLIIDTSDSDQTVYHPGEPLTFDVTLIGKAVDFLSYIVVAFRELGSKGLGPGRGRFRLARVEAVTPFEAETALVYQVAQPDRVQTCALSVDVAQISAWAKTWPTERVTLTLRTPTRLKHHGRMMRQGPPFHVLVRRLLDRVSSLAYFHCEQRWELDFRGWIERAKAVEIAETTTHWESWTRHSRRQDREIRMGGLTGQVTYAGDVAPYRALLALGTLVHVGKGTVFGNGRLVV